MRGNIAQLMQQAQRMQENLKTAQEELGAPRGDGPVPAAAWSA